MAVLPEDAPEQDLEITSVGKRLRDLRLERVELFTMTRGEFEAWKRPVLIESVWDESKKPDTETINGLRGKRVAVTGKLNASPPGRIANMAIPTVSPVDKLELIE